MTGHRISTSFLLLICLLSVGCNRPVFTPAPDSRHYNSPRAQSLLQWAETEREGYPSLGKLEKVYRRIDQAQVPVELTSQRKYLLIKLATELAYGWARKGDNLSNPIRPRWKKAEHAYRKALFPSQLCDSLLQLPVTSRLPYAHRRSL